MKLSKRGEYALRSLVALGVAWETGRELVCLGELAREEDIPQNFLQLILIDLRKAGLAESVRGKNGGYRLAQPAAEIVIGDVVRLIDGPLAPIRCVSLTAYEKCSCPDEATCGLRLLMQEVRSSIATLLDRVTLADIVAGAVLHRKNAGTVRRTPSREGFIEGEGI